MKFDIRNFLGLCKHKYILDNEYAIKNWAGGVSSYIKLYKCSSCGKAKKIKIP